MVVIIAILICLTLNAVLAGAETAFIAVNKSILKLMEKQGNSSAKLLLNMRDNPERTLSVIQIGITFVGALAAATGGAGAEEIIAPLVMDYFGLSDAFAEILSLLLVVIPLTFVTVVFAELVPKTLALRRPTELSTKVAPYLHSVSILLNPIVSALEWSTRKVIDLFPSRHTHQEEAEQSEVDADQLSVLSPINKQYVINLLKIEETRVGDIMIPWADVIHIGKNLPLEDVEATIVSSAHTRLPVIEDKDVVGIINAKEFFAFLKTTRRDWQFILRPAIKLPHTTPILTALQIMQSQRAHIVIVYNGNTKQGIVTMEAIFEEIIGDIYDEDDDGTLKRILDSVHFKKR